jgi:tRNA A-37 threonylcarbamoyl transferase component Bud32
VEQLLAEFPLLVAQEDMAVELIYAEHVLRPELGEHPTPDNWFARFPQWRDRLQQRFQAHEALAASISPSAGTTIAAPGRSRPRDPAAANVFQEQDFAHYRLLSKLGEGGMGVVYRVWDTVLNREVALKQLRPGILADDEQLQRFQREARAASLQHRHIVPILEFGEFRGVCYYTMPLLPGGSLNQHLGRFQADVRTAVALMEKVARAVQATHAAGIVHRDLKPANLLLDACDEPLVSDFGLAKFLDGNADLTQSGQILGTPAYMAPEQAAGNTRSVTPRSDVWGLGVILYELLTGERPFPGKRKEEVLRQVLQAQPRPPRQLRRDLDRGLETIVLKCLEKEPALRYATVGDLADDLGRWLRGEPIRARLPGWYVRGGRSVSRLLRVPLVAVVLGAVLAAGGLLVVGRLGRVAPETAPEPIPLLGSAGLPTSGRWLLGKGDLTAADEGVIRVRTDNKCLGLVELLALPPWKRFRFRATIQDMGNGGLVGIYVAGREQASPVGCEYWFCQLTYAEHNDRPVNPEGKARLAQAVLALRRYGGVTLNSPPMADVLQPVTPPFHFLAAKQATWRWLVLEVAPDKVCAFFDVQQTPFAAIPHAVTMNELCKQLAERLPVKVPNPPPLGPQGGIGLVCEGGEALVREAILEPLPNRN